MHDNVVMLEGNLTANPEITFTKNGRHKAGFALAVKRRWRNRHTDTWEEHVSFFNVVCWADLADHVGESLTKGHRVRVSGRLEQRSWTTAEGDKRSTVEVVASDVGPSLRFNTVEVAPRSHDSPAAEGPSEPEAVTYPDGKEPF